MTIQNQIATYKLQIKNVLSQIKIEHNDINNSNARVKPFPPKNFKN